MKLYCDSFRYNILDFTDSPARNIYPPTAIVCLVAFLLRHSADARVGKLSVLCIYRIVIRRLSYSAHPLFFSVARQLL